ncbi:hypothetical protein [Nocardia sp. NPDC005366]|uniref:hypothetical protein n=1 Tax=Nocardia sp. NPDC005366 TaxID=3156878 RepID=UPI0033A167C2
MITPTRAQTRVLKAIQNSSRALAALLTEAAGFDGAPPPQWFGAYQHHAIARENLIAAATAGAVPAAWLDQARARGERGIGWRADLYLTAPGPTDWDRVLRDLSEDVARIREWEALDAAHQQLHHGPDTTSASLRTNVTALSMRTTGVANLLGLTADQATGLWGELDDLAAAGAAGLDGVAAEQIRHRWHTAADTDTSGWAGQAATLATAGVDIEASPALPAAQALRTAIASALAPVHALFLAARDPEFGAALDAAIPDIDQQSSSLEVLFSNAPVPDEPFSGANAGTVPVFQSAQVRPW